MKLYDVQIDLSSGDGGLPRDSIKDWMRVRLFGNSVTRKVLVPPLIAVSVYFKNDGEEVSIRQGAAIPIKIGRGEAIHVMFDGTPGGMCKVGG